MQPILKKGFRQHSLSEYFRRHHNRDPSQLSFCATDRIDQYWWGTNMKQAFHETKWIYQLWTMAPTGLNVEIYIVLLTIDRYHQKGIFNNIVNWVFMFVHVCVCIYSFKILTLRLFF